MSPIRLILTAAALGGSVRGMGGCGQAVAGLLQDELAADTAPVGGDRLPTSDRWSDVYDRDEFGAERFLLRR